MVNPRNITHEATNVSSTGNGLPYCHSTLGDRRRQQLVALLYANGGGMAMRELLTHPDCPPLAETIIHRNPTWFVVGSSNVRLEWVDADRVKSNRQRLSRRAGGVA